MADQGAVEQKKGLNPAAFAFIRDEWINSKMKEKISEYTEEKVLRMYFGTWNVNAKKPANTDLTPWLARGEADVYCIGFQEIVDLNAVNLISDHTALRPWEALIEEALNHEFVQIGSEHLVGLALVVYVRKSLQHEIAEVMTETCGVGIMGVGGNKGGVAIRFRVHDSTVCVVNAHLAAHKQNVQGRNQDYHNICRRIAFPAPVRTGGVINPNLPPKMLSIYEHDHVFWIGDLNYRLDINDMEHVFSRIEAQDWTYLTAHDQLIQEKAAGNAFKGWSEGRIDFGPTYKYQPGTNEYEQREDKKRRIPAWCDRIQWVATGNSSDIKQLYYRRSELDISDHKPVMSNFEVKVKILVKEKQQQVYHALVRQLDAWENECIPKVSISRNQIVFPAVSFDTPAVQKLAIENTGQVMVQFTFIPKLQEENFCKRWLTVEPAFGIIPPKETLEILLTVHVTKDTAQPLNTEEDTLDDILIFRLENGRDYFVTITGEYLKSCFGSTIEYLVKTPMPVRLASSEQQSSKVLTLPKELWRIVDYIFHRGMDEEGLFTVSGNAKQIERIRECLDVGQEFGNFGIHSMAETLVRFLESLAEPVFPKALCNQYQETMNLTAWCKQALMQLSAAHYNAFIYMTSFLREVLKHSHKNRLHADQLAFIFSSCLMHSDHISNPNRQQGRPKALIILRHFLTSDEFV